MTRLGIKAQTSPWDRSASSYPWTSAEQADYLMSSDADPRLRELWLADASERGQLIRDEIPGQWAELQELLPIEAAFLWEQSKLSPLPFNHTDFFMSRYLAPATSDELYGSGRNMLGLPSGTRRRFAFTLTTPKVLTVLQADFYRMVNSEEYLQRVLTSENDELKSVISEVRNGDGKFPESMFRYFAAVASGGRPLTVRLATTPTHKNAMCILKTKNGFLHSQVTIILAGDSCSAEQNVCLTMLLLLLLLHWRWIFSKETERQGFLAF